MIQIVQTILGDSCYMVSDGRHIKELVPLNWRAN